MLGKIIIPPSLKKQASFRLLHLSDTPSQIYSDLRSLIHTIKPTHIVHTGDLVDDVKLEIFPNQQDQYAYKLKNLSKVLACKNLHIAVGNHDDRQLIKKHFTNAQIANTFDRLDTPYGVVYYAHKFHAIKNMKADYFMFGHNLDQKSQIDLKPAKLNGLEALYVIDSNSSEIISLNYPRFTDDYRLKKSRMGF